MVFALDSGEQEATFCIGDDIPALVTDCGGSIWTAYGDEGIYGGHPESAAGPAGWSAEGQATWAPEGRLPDMPLEGCTAATEGDRVWLIWNSGSRRGGAFLTRITPSTGEVTSGVVRRWQAGGDVGLYDCTSQPHESAALRTPSQRRPTSDGTG
ncbi:hypothetical protein ACIRG4_33040 [Streptomyces sp. NPDC102395]|uniref:hypothetical protein n=1 Tax=Streptomyces sp. NPDC102395 TaxID=3366168 RepID=UPI003805257B